MMSTDKLTPDQTKVAVLAELSRGTKASVLAVKYKVNPNTIVSWRREARKQAEQQKAEEIAKTDPVVLEVVAQEIKAKAREALPPIEYRKLDAQITAVVDGVNGYQILDTAFQNTMLNMLEWANARITDDMELKDWGYIVEKLGILHQTLYSKESAQVINILQNSGGEGGAVNAFSMGLKD